MSSSSLSVVVHAELVHPISHGTGRIPNPVEIRRAVDTFRKSNLWVSVTNVIVEETVTREMRVVLDETMAAKACRFDASELSSVRQEEGTKRK
jgi:hypothetical protein